MGVMFIGMYLGHFFAYDGEIAYEKSMTFLKYVIFFLLMVNLINNRYKLRWFINALMLSAAWMVYKCYDLRWAWNYGGRFEYRDGGAISDANLFSAALVLLLPLVVQKAFDAANQVPLRIGAAIGTFGIIMSIVIAGSRGAFLGIITCGFLILLQAKKSRTSIIILLAVVSIFAYPKFSEMYLDRIATIFNDEALEEDDSAQSRLEMWSLAANVWAEHPVLGCGIGNFRYYSGDFRSDDGWGSKGLVTHSIWFQTLSEGGLVVLIPLLLLLLLFFYRTNRAIQRLSALNQRSLVGELYALRSSMVGFLICATFINRLFYEPIYWWCALAYIYDRLITSEVENEKLKTENETPEAITKLKNKGQLEIGIGGAG